MRGLRGVGLSGLASPTMSAGCPGGAAIPIVWDNGAMDAWVTDQIWVQSLAPKTGSTGNMDAWITDHLWIQAYGNSGV